jgi:glutamyl-tRNA synthetase
VKTRLAPTPSGFLHLGNAANFLLCWLWARTQGGKVVLRIEDTDTTRRRTEFVESLFRDLEWLGLDWDEGPNGPTDAQCPWFQSSRLRTERYVEVIDLLAGRGDLFPCRCTRKELSLAAPQVARIEEDAGIGPLYPGTCRGRKAGDAGASDAWRLRLPECPSSFEDLWRGRQNLSSLEALGAPVLKRGDGCIAYHLAVCVDDADQGITHVLRGRDLLPWTHLHKHLHGLLGHPAPVFGHHPLLGGAGGERLAKSAGSTSLRSLREGGVAATSVLGRLARFLHPKAPVVAEIPLDELLGWGIPDPGTIDLPLEFE